MNQDDLDALARAAELPVHVQPRRAVPPARQAPIVPAAIFVTPPAKPARQYSPFHWGFGIVLGMVAAWLLILLVMWTLREASDQLERAERKRNTPPPPAATVAPPIVTAASASLITNAITYQQAVSLLGCEATKRRDEDTGEVSYTWKNSDESWLALYFRNGKLVRKKMLGLPSGPSVAVPRREKGMFDE